MLLRELLHSRSMSALWNNILSSLLSAVYMKIIMELATYWRRRSGLRTRQLIHMALSSWIGFWPLFDVSDWSWRLNVLVPAVVGTRYLYKAMIQKDPTDDEVINMSRTSSPWDLIYGPLQLTILMVWLGLTQFMQPEAAILLAAVGIGDGLAPLIGRRYGRHLYCMPMAKPKSMEGSVCGVFLGTIAGCYLYPYLLGMDWFPLRIVLAYGGIAAVVEGVSPGNLDNVFVPLVLYFSIDKVDRWMPA